MITRKELAEILSVHINTIDNWIKQGLPHKKIFHTIRFDLEEVKQWIESKKC